MKLTEDIKEFLEQGGKVLVVENDQPSFVIVPFKKYMQDMRGASSMGNTGRGTDDERLQEITLESALRDANMRHAESTATFAKSVEEINNEIRAVTSDDFFSLPRSTGYPEEEQAQHFYREPL